MIRFNFEIRTGVRRGEKLKLKMDQLKQKLIEINRAVCPRSFDRIIRRIAGVERRLMKLQFKMYDEEKKGSSSGTKMIYERKERDAIAADLDRIGGSATLLDFSDELIHTWGEFRKVETIFEHLLDNKENVRVLMMPIVKMAAEVSLDVQAVVKGVQQLLAYGVRVEEVNNILNRLSYVASGKSDLFGDLVDLYGRSLVQGYLVERDIPLFEKLGISLKQELALIWGKTEGEMEAVLAGGQIEFSDMECVLWNVADKCISIHELSLRTIVEMEEFDHAWEQLTDFVCKENVNFTSVDLLAKHYEQLGRIIVSLIAAYGVYRATTIICYVLSGTNDVFKAMIQSAPEKMTTMQRSIFAKIIPASPYVFVTALLVGVVTAIGSLNDGVKMAEGLHER